MLAFWLGAIFATYTYVGYPLLIRLVAQMGGMKLAATRKWENLPRVTFVVAAFNERRRIRAKVQDLLSTSYPADLRRVIVVSDGSTDGTEDEVPVHPAVTLLRQDRGGKPSALNRAVRMADSEILIFCDVRQSIETDAPRRLVDALADPAIGAVGGELAMLDSGSATSKNLGAYWRYEKALRAAESMVDSSVGLSGALYAMRRSDWEDLPDDTVLDDLLVPMRLVRRGMRVVVDPSARFFDGAQETLEGERRRKLRTLSGNFQLFQAHRWVLSPFRNRIWWQFYSHKVFRLLVPYALLAMLLGTALSDSPLASWLFWAQVAAYGAALAGLCSPHLRQLRAFNVAAMFLDLNLIALQALPASRSGRLDARWEKA